ncbi:MAG TPA: FAD-binding oxidoreductase, partial [Dehalococcoidia bacterium]|nr:FAD-binding oxidoreductase [Dehalococcoidia bacterium]
MGQSQSLKIKDLIPELKRIVGDNYVLDDQADLLVYEYDASIDRGNPVVVVSPAPSG